MSNFMKPQLLCESNSWYRATPDEIKQNRDKNGGKIVLQSCLQRAGRRNQMGRVYPLELLQREFKAFQKKVDSRSAFGECDHSDTATVSLLNASHIITKQWWQKSDDGQWDEWWGDIEVLSTPSGKIIQNLIEDGTMVSLSSRGVGTVQRAGDADIVQNNFILLTVDFVSAPSVHDAVAHLKEGIDILSLDPYDRKRYLENEIKYFLDIDLKSRNIIQYI